MPSGTRTPAKHVHVVNYLPTILTDLLILYMVFQLCFITPSWGWSLPLHQKAEVLVVLAVLTSAISVAITQLPSPARLIKLILTIVLCLVTLVSALWLGAYSPTPPSVQYKLEQMQLSQLTFASLPPCDKIHAFAEAGYAYIDLGHEMVLVPKWMQDTLKGEPKSVLVHCISDELARQSTSLHGDNVEHEIATQKIYALAFEAWDLNVLNDEAVLGAIKRVACINGADPFGKLRILYFFGKKGSPPAFDYYSDNGQQALYIYMCSK